MDNKNILIVSNNGLSNSESNGRILSLLFHDIHGVNIHNFCLRGILNKKNISYIRIGDKKNIKSLLSFGIVKPDLFCLNEDLKDDNSGNQTIIKKKKSFYYFIRNILYLINFHITNFLTKYIKQENIGIIFLFGADAPYMYRLARKLSKKTDSKLIIYTCEDYPIKNYNYIEKDKDDNLFFKLLMSSLRKQVKKAYDNSYKSFFNSVSLMNDYKVVFNIDNENVKYLPSILGKVEYNIRRIKRIVYGGNLYHNRVISIIDFSDVIFEIDSSVVVEIYGKITEEDLNLLDSKFNIRYNGTIDYQTMVEIYKKADMLLHIEGFNDYSIKDFKHAFSTKISDCYKLGIPFFMYSPKEVASTQYGLEISPQFVAIDKEDLKNKLTSIINLNIRFNSDNNRAEEDFKPFTYEDFIN